MGMGTPTLTQPRSPPRRASHVGAARSSVRFRRTGAGGSASEYGVFFFFFSDGFLVLPLISSFLLFGRAGLTIYYDDSDGVRAADSCASTLFPPRTRRVPVFWETTGMGMCTCRAQTWQPRNERATATGPNERVRRELGRGGGGCEISGRVNDTFCAGRKK
jgi:hypothetical protein